jgi:glycosyltransferase involved in cell wall biosynthesis
MSSRPTLTAAIITLNEARNLPGLLDSLAWTDEIVVVDGGSTDATAKIAEARGCQVTIRRFDGFASQRNFARAMARGQWVLSIDADERPTAALAAEIRRRTAQDGFEAFHLPIRSRIFGRAFRRSGTQDDRPVRLFRRDSACWVGAVHEVLRVSGRVGMLQNWLTHETLPDLATFLAKMDRYTTLEAEARMAAGRTPRLGDLCLAPWVEVFRRLIWKQGCFDGPEGWTFCGLSGWSQWVLARKHRRRWAAGRQGTRALRLDGPAARLIPPSAWDRAHA